MLRIHGNKFSQSKLSRMSWPGLAGTISCCALAFAIGLMLFPSLPQHTSAYDYDPDPGPGGVVSGTGASVGISLPTSIDFADVLPTPSGATTTATANLTITTSDSAGYSLYLYSSDGDNSLRPKISSLANISTINATAGDVGLTLSSLKPNTWGYNLGTEAPTDATTYTAVPTDKSTPIQTKDTSATNSANDTYTLSFGAKVDSTIASGAYSNALTVAVVAEPRAIIYIQDLTLADCQSRASDADFTVTDRRDDNDYTVRYINGACWMTQNLRLSGGQTLTSADSNVASSWSFPSTPLANSSYSYTEPQVTISSNTSYGGYYNFCAASAGTNCQSSSNFNTTYDICPRGWRLPTNGEMSSVTSYTSAFSPVYSGRYYNGSIYDTGSYGIWWSATASSSSNQHRLNYYSGSLGASNIDKYYGLSVRCIRSNPGTLTINFNGNGSTGGSTASQQIAAGNTASLSANGFTRTGYAFTGWNTAADGSGTSYADGADYTVTPATGDATITLYAQWGPSIQDFTNAQCQSLASNGNYTVYDIRDGSDYTVRYINGACWMTQNLRLSGSRTLTPSDSDVDSNWTFPNNSLTSGDSYTEARYAISDDSQHATEYGGYYNYCAASAGSVCEQTKMDATQSICPKGWKLPTGGSDSQQSGIAGTSYVDAFSPVYSGYYRDGSLYSPGSSGYWWSATAHNSFNQYYLYYNGSSLDTSGDYNRNNGYSVRCIRSS